MPRLPYARPLKRIEFISEIYLAPGWIRTEYPWILEHKM